MFSLFAAWRDSLICISRPTNRTSQLWYYCHLRVSPARQWMRSPGIRDTAWTRPLSRSGHTRTRVWARARARPGTRGRTRDHRPWWRTWRRTQPTWTERFNCAMQSTFIRQEWTLFLLRQHLEYWKGHAVGGSEAVLGTNVYDGDMFDIVSHWNWTPILVQYYIDIDT